MQEAIRQMEQVDRELAQGALKASCLFYLNAPRELRGIGSQVAAAVCELEEGSGSGFHPIEILLCALGANRAVGEGLVSEEEFVADMRSSRHVRASKD